MRFKLDINEQREKGSVLQESYELRETIFSNVHFLIAYMDKDFNFIRVNRAYAEADGRSPDFFIGKNYFHLYPNIENENIFRIVVATGSPFFVYGKPFKYPLHPERGVSYWDWTLQPTRISSSGVKSIVLIMINVAKRKQAEETLMQAKAGLEQQQAAGLRQRDEQIARLSFELTQAEQRERNRIAEILHDYYQQLLVGARMRLELLIRDLDDSLKPEAEYILGLIDQSIRSARTLTSDLNLPILESNDLFDYLEWLAQWMFEIHGFEVKLRVEPPINVEQRDIILFLFNSVRELLFNALKYSGVKSATVQAEIKNNRELKIVVEDRGAGLNPDMIWKDAGSGRKFGLITIRKRLMNIGGRFMIESLPNEGTIVSMIVPLDVESADEMESSESPEETTGNSFRASKYIQKSGEKIRVMLADDSPVMREGLSMMLNLHSDIEVVGEASDGEEAVQMARELVPDVILMDNRMPKMDGPEAIRRIHSEFPNIRIIGLSMYDEDIMTEDMINAGAESVRSKNGDTDSLLTSIREGCTLTAKETGSGLNIQQN